MLLSDDGTTSLSNTSMENVIMAVFRDGRRVSPPCGPEIGPWGTAPDVDASSLPAITASIAGRVLLSLILL